MVLLVRYWLNLVVCGLLQPGDKAMVVPTLAPDEAKKLFPNLEVKEVPSGKQYLRFTPDY